MLRAALARKHERIERPEKLVAVLKQTAFSRRSENADLDRFYLFVALDQQVSQPQS
jgi:hypothetical protein